MFSALCELCANPLRSLLGFDLLSSDYEKREFIKFGGLLAGIVISGNSSGIVNESMKSINPDQTEKGHH